MIFRVDCERIYPKILLPPELPPAGTELHQRENAPDHGMPNQVMSTLIEHTQPVPTGVGEASEPPVTAPGEARQELPELVEPPLPPVPE